VGCRITRDEAEFTVRDDGRGFDAAHLPAGDGLAGQPGIGRGLTLMRSIMDDVSYNPAGNEVRLLKRRAPEEPEEEVESTRATRQQ
jgi:anti-sigma regulatory factor (Ser/Thr protein kinase)